MNGYPRPPFAVAGSRRPSCNRLISFTLLLGLARILCPGADWPQWRGPNRDGISSETVPTSWPAEGPRKIWTAEVGTGFSAVAIARGRAYTLGNTQNTDTIWCLDANTGKEAWRHSYPARLDPQYYEGGPGSTPTVDGGHVFTLSKWGDALCLDAATGALVWQRSLRTNDVTPNRWGFSGSPLVLGRSVIYTAGTRGTALDRRTGQVLWQTGSNTTGYASPVLIPPDASRASGLLLIFGAKALYGVDPDSGQERWSHPWQTAYDLNAPDPVVRANEIFVSSHSRGCALLSLSPDKPELVYDRTTLNNHLSPSVLVGDFLYGFDGEASRRTEFRCLEFRTGELKWAAKDPAFGSLIVARDTLVVLSARGDLVLAKASPEDFTVLARAHVIDGRCWTPPSLAHGKLYVRNAAGKVLCFELRPDASN